MRNYTPCCVPPPNAREAAYLLPRHFQIWSPKYCSAGSPRTSRSNRGACISCSCPSPGSAASIASAFSWSLRLVLRNAMVAESGITWLMRILRTGTCSSLSDLARRALSLAAIIVGMATMMNSVRAGSRNSCRASSMFALTCSSLSTAGSRSAWNPNMPFTESPASFSFWRSRKIFPTEASRKSGRLSIRSVWPVGAVSKTMHSNLAYSSAFRKATTLLMATASSTPGGVVSSS
mmetsp:Transcript_28960/g.74321  ORF Transcript_28960/g.74321 Transcript_28960/m.74321 type:complete len:234 (-) Transcript_28960:2459-3160(-)